MTERVSSYLGGREGGGPVVAMEANEFRLAESIDVLVPIVLLLNLDGTEGTKDMVLSRLLYNEGVLPLIIMLCLAVLLSIFFSAFGKYSVRWFVMSSLEVVDQRSCELSWELQRKDQTQD